MASHHYALSHRNIRLPLLLLSLLKTNDQARARTATTWKYKRVWPITAQTKVNFVTKIYWCHKTSTSSRKSSALNKASNNTGKIQQTQNEHNENDMENMRKITENITDDKMVSYNTVTFGLLRLKHVIRKEPRFAIWRRLRKIFGKLRCAGRKSK